MFARRLQLLCGSMLFGAMFVTTPVGRAQSAEKITPSQAEAMVRRFIASPEGAKLHLNATTRFGGTPCRGCDPYVVPDDGSIRWGRWRVDPVKETVLQPRRDSQIEGSYVKKGDEYVIQDAREVNITRIKPDEAKAMLLKFLASPEAAKMPPWVADSHRLVETSTPSEPSPANLIEAGPWRVDPYLGTVLLPTDSAELKGTFERDGEEYAIKTTVVREVRRIEPAEARAMVLRFVVSAETKKLDPLITNTRELVEDSSPSVNAHGDIWVGRWWVNSLTQEVQLSTTFHVWYGEFVKENDTYTMFLLSEMFVSPAR